VGTLDEIKSRHGKNDLENIFIELVGDRSESCRHVWIVFKKEVKDIVRDKRPFLPVYLFQCC